MTMPHLDDEQLSVHLDGEQDVDVGGHVASCPACESRLADLAAVASLVGAPVASPPDEVREVALAASAQAWAEYRAGARTSDGPRVVELERRRRLPRWALPVAAAAAALLVAVPVLSSSRDSKDRSQTTFAADSADSGRTGPPEVAGTDGGNLGEQSDPAALGLAVRGALPGAASEAALAAPPAPATAAAREQTDETAPSTVAGAPQAGTPEGAGRAAPGNTTKGSGKPLANPPCATTARTTYGKGLGPLLYAARLRWQGEPAVALAYRLADAGAPGLDYRVLVLATADCRLLVVQSL